MKQLCLFFPPDDDVTGSSHPDAGADAYLQPFAGDVGTGVGVLGVG